MTSQAKHQRIWDTSLENWPDDLLDLMGPLDVLPLTREDLVYIASAMPSFEAERDVGAFAPRAFSEAFSSAVAECFPRSGDNSVFPRLGATSLTGSKRVLPITHADALYRLLRRPNPRLASFVIAMLEDDQVGHVYLRPFLSLLPWGSFRVIVLKGCVAGVSQADTEQFYGEIKEHRAEVIAAIQRLLHIVMPRLHLSSVVIEVGLTGNPEGLQAHLIELNPAIRRTDIGFFDWLSVGDFDGSFRYASRSEEDRGVR